MWGKETTMLCAFFFSDLGADGLKAIVNDCTIHSSFISVADDMK